MRRNELLLAVLALLLLASGVFCLQNAKKSSAQAELFPLSPGSVPFVPESVALGQGAAREGLLACFERYVGIKKEEILRSESAFCPNPLA